MKNIWQEGFEIVRDGQRFTLNYTEIRDIFKAIRAMNGQGSIQYWLDTYEEDEDTPADKIKVAKDMLEDEDFCVQVWDNFMDDLFYDSGEVECEAVDYTINDYIENIKEKMSNG